MDLIKKLTGKNPSEYEKVAKSLVDNADVELFSKLVKQDDFLFDFIKNNVAKRIQTACNQDNHLNLLKFLGFYSPSYSTMITSVLHCFSGDELLPTMKEKFINGTNDEKAYAVKYFSLVSQKPLLDMIPLLRKTAESDFEPLALNSIELLSLLNDTESKTNAIKKLESNDEFEQYEAVKFLVAYQAKDCLGRIIDVMKHSSLAENIASEIPYLIPIEELLNGENFDNGILVLCNIINAIPEILQPSVVCDYGLYNILESLPLTSTTAVLFRFAKEKFKELCSNEEYLFDCDKNTKEEIIAISSYLDKYNNELLKSLLYDELFEESDFVFYALDFVEEIEELEAMLDSKNETLILKTLTILKEKSYLNDFHKKNALNIVNNNEIRNIIEVL